MRQIDPNKYDSSGGVVELLPGGKQPPGIHQRVARIEDRCASIEGQLDEVQASLRSLHVRVSLWSALAAAVGGLLAHFL